ncbi:extracellular solute-binding protein [Pullulanibacillus sp. KACC 23026]|uniref:extracellular solute-binding protein n=1 Tax=Pullulanibacillus sp. KACC 23026 TaxID=3028315 RepID=UPI0023B11033|nr:extracellular solute-binding protein [Pullulanibacillus sp. KACC 23026]WEG12833.1 extracellular solute-binding protein [Pullulanibacillus sp. KACC 23026]
MKKWFSSLALLLTLCLALAGCGSNNSSNGSSKSNSGDDGNKVITLWSSTTGPDGQKIQKTIDQYNATNPEYKVKLVTMQGTTFNSKLASVTRSGQGVPDLALIASESVSAYQSQGMLEPWDQYIKGTKVTASNYLKEAWNVGTIGGQQYGLPSTMGTWVMYYNPDLVNKYCPGAVTNGVVTYSSIEKCGATAKNDGIYSYGNAWGMQNFNNLYLQMGGHFSANGKPTIDTPTAVKTMQEFKKIYDEGYMPKKDENADQLFEQGKIIFLPEGTWMLSEFQKIKGFKPVETFTPQWDASHIVQASGADQFVMFKSNARTDVKAKAEVKFIQWLQGNQLTWVKSGANPTALAMLNNPDYTKMPQSFLIKDSSARNAIKIITDPGASYSFSGIDGAFWDMVDGKAGINSKLKEVQQTVNSQMGQ